MPTHSKPHNGNSPFGLLTELAVEATSSLVEAQRTLLDLAQKENDVLLKGIHERVGAFPPVAAMTEFVRRSFDHAIDLQQDLLTATSKQTLHWLEAEKKGKGERSAHLVELAHQAVETFARAQKKFLDVVAEESVKIIEGKHETKPARKTEIAHLAGEAANAFIDTQKRLLDVVGQQMNVNLDVAARSMEMMSLSRLFPKANLPGEGLKSFLDAETSLIGSLVGRKKPAVRAGERHRPVKKSKAAPAPA